MEKSQIKAILRETFVLPVKEEEQGEPKKNPNHDKDYAFVQNKLNGTMLKASQVMASAGLGNPDDATDRSLFSKKLRKEKNDEGGLYQFSDKELSAVVKVINNPVSYLTTKK